MLSLKTDVFRLMDTPTKFVNPPTMTKPHCCRTLSSNLGVRTVMRKANSLSLS